MSSSAKTCMSVNLRIHRKKHTHTLDGNCIIAGKCGAIEAIADAMKTHSDNANVCQNGCNALTNITANGKCCRTQTHTELAWVFGFERFFCYTLDDNRVIAGKCGAIEAVVGVMKARLHSADSCYCGYCALTNITANGKMLPHTNTHRISMSVWIWEIFFVTH